MGWNFRLPGFFFAVCSDLMSSPELTWLPSLASWTESLQAIGIAGDATCVYPFASPGGWSLVGRVVGTTLFSDGGALLQLGDRVRFEPC